MAKEAHGKRMAAIAYSGRGIARPRYHANDHSRDILEIEHHPMAITDARDNGPALDREGFCLIPHQSAVADFTDLGRWGGTHRSEIASLISAQTGADHVTVTAPGVLRFSERSGKAGSLNNSMPARFAHVDVSDATAARFAAMGCPERREFSRFAQYNIWRCFSGAPQDVPLALCDARSVAPDDLILADAVFDEPDKPEWSFEGWVVAHNPDHCWHWFSDLTRDEAIIFKTNDSDPTRAHCVPHVAFDDPACSAEATPRASIEMRATAYWFE